MYSIAGFGKVKTAGQFAALSNHNNRIKLTVSEAKRIDSGRTPLNKVLTNPLQICTESAGGMGKAIRDYYEKNKIVVKKDSVLAIDLMLTASPEFFGEWHKNGAVTPEAQPKIDAWAKTQLEFVKKEFGEKAVKFAVLHLDETTPHIHFVITPEETKTLRYKNKYGSGVKEVTSLNANRWPPIFWKKFVTRYAKANEHLGLRRGIMNSVSENVPIKEYGEMIEVALKTDYTKAIKKIVSEISENLNVVNTKGAVEKMLVEKLLPKLNPLLRSNKALKQLSLRDRAKEYRLIEKLRVELDTELAIVRGQKEYYGKGIKIRKELEGELAAVRAENDALSLENSQLKRRLEPVRLVPTNAPSIKLRA